MSYLIAIIALLSVPYLLDLALSSLSQPTLRTAIATRLMRLRDTRIRPHPLFLPTRPAVRRPPVGRPTSTICWTYGRFRSATVVSMTAIRPGWISAYGRLR